jgi:glycosyltransferase involved in cell wall biosynthesis
MIVEGYTASNAELPLIVVGSAPYADAYTQRVHSLADGRVTFLGGVWDQELLDQLYANAFTYLHGHSVGGTNPSLLRALGASAPTTAFDVNFNREVLGEAGRYFRDAADVRTRIEDSESDVALTVELGTLARIQAKRYDWDEVTDRYEELCLRLAGRDRVLSGAGHRTGPADDTVIEMAQRQPVPIDFPAAEQLVPVDVSSDLISVPVRRSA